MATHRHQRENRVRRTRLSLAVTGALAVTATLTAVVVTTLHRDPPAAAPRPAALSAAALVDRGRADTASRGLSRLSAGNDLAPKAAQVARQEAQDRARRLRERQATTRAVRQADTRLWATADLNVWTEPQRGEKSGLIDDGDKVLVTGRKRDGRTEVVVAHRSRWVTDGYLSQDKPLGVGAGLSMAPCPDGSVENGLTSGAVHVYRSVCRAFPQVTSYGGWDAHGEHSSGKAIDIMTSDVALGTAIATFLQSHASELGLYDIIWRQHIWTPVRAGEGWRSMPSRGSATANHYDHVHVAVN